MFLWSIAPKASDLASIASHIYNWGLFLIWLCLFILSGVISPLILQNILGTYRPGSSSFSVLSFCLFILFVGFSRQEYWSGLPFPSLVDHILSELSTMTRPSWVALHGMAHSFIELAHSFIHVCTYTFSAPGPLSFVKDKVMFSGKFQFKCGCLVFFFLQACLYPFYWKCDL